MIDKDFASTVFDATSQIHNVILAELDKVQKPEDRQDPMWHYLHMMLRQTSVLSEMAYHGAGLGGNEAWLK